MDFKTYIPLALRTAILHPSDMRRDLVHASLGMITEIGEFTTEVKRNFAYDKPIDDAMRKHMIEEIGDVQWYVPLAMAAFGIDELPFEDVGADMDIQSAPLSDLCLFISTCATSVHASVLFGQDSDKELVATMLGGMIYAIDTRIAPLLGIEPGEIRQQNIDKLRKRFPDKFTPQAAEERADKNGLPATES